MSPNSTFSPVFRRSYDFSVSQQTFINIFIVPDDFNFPEETLQTLKMDVDMRDRKQKQFKLLKSASKITSFK